MRNLRLALVLAVVYVDMLGGGLVYPILPRLVQHFQHGDVGRAAYSFGLLVSAYWLTQFLFAPLFGALSDSIGRRPIMLAALGGAAIAYSLMATASGLVTLAAAQMLAGVMGGSFTTASAYLADVTPPERRAQSFGLVGAAFGFGLITGPAIGGILGGINLHLPFVAAAGLCAANLLFGFFALPESLPPGCRTPFRLSNANPLTALRHIGRYGSLTSLLAIFVLASFANWASEAIWVLYAGYRFHWGATEIGISLALAGAFFVVGQGWLPRLLVPRIGECRSILLGVGVSVLVCIGYGSATQGWMLYCVMPFSMIGWPLAQPAVQGLMSRAVPSAEQGLLQGAMASVTGLTTIAGPLIWSGLFGYFVGPNAPVVVPGMAFYVSASLFVAAFLLTARWRRGVAMQPIVA
ncbi:MAG TPA: MFS transporter [Rhizomicrobium sp.]